MKCSLGFDTPAEYLRPPVYGEAFAFSTSLFFFGSFCLFSLR